VTPDGHAAVFASWNNWRKTLKIWDLETGEENLPGFIDSVKGWVTAEMVTIDGRITVILFYKFGWLAFTL